MSPEQDFLAGIVPLMPRNFSVNRSVTHSPNGDSTIHFTHIGTLKEHDVVFVGGWLSNAGIEAIRAAVSNGEKEVIE